MFYNSPDPRNVITGCGGTVEADTGTLIYPDDDDVEVAANERAYSFMNLLPFDDLKLYT